MSRKCRWVFLGLLALAQIGIVVCYVSMLRGTASAEAASPMPVVTNDTAAPAVAEVTESKTEPVAPAPETKDAVLPNPPPPAATGTEAPPAADDHAPAAEPAREVASEKPAPKKDPYLEHPPLYLPPSPAAPPLPAPAAAPPPAVVAVAPPPPAPSSPAPLPSPGGADTKKADSPPPLPSADKPSAGPSIPAPPPLAVPTETKPAVAPPPPPSLDKGDKGPPAPSVSIPAPPAPTHEKAADPLLAPPAPTAPALPEKAAPPPPPAATTPVSPEPPLQTSSFGVSKPDAPAARVDNPAAPCPWTLRMEIVKGRTQLEARVGKEVQFRVDCTQLSIGAPSGCLSARGDVHLTGSDLDGTCEGLTINWQDDHVLLDGKAHLKCLRNGQDVELNADHLSLRLSTSTSIKGTSSAARKAYAKPDASAEECEDNDLK